MTTVETVHHGKGRREESVMDNLHKSALEMFTSGQVTMKVIGKTLNVSQPTLIKWKRMSGMGGVRKPNDLTNIERIEEKPEVESGEVGGVMQVLGMLFSLPPKDLEMVQSKCVELKERMRVRDLEKAREELKLAEESARIRIEEAKARLAVLEVKV
jgi:hypothetical protein